MWPSPIIAAREQRVGGERGDPVADLVARDPTAAAGPARSARRAAGPTRRGRCRRRRRPPSAGNCSAMSSAWPSVEITPRSAAYIGCSGSIARTTPAAAASSTSAPIGVARPGPGRRRGRGRRRAARPRRAPARAPIRGARRGERRGLLDRPAVVVERGPAAGVVGGGEEAAAAQASTPAARSRRPCRAAVGEADLGDRLAPQPDRPRCPLSAVDAQRGRRGRRT